MRLYASSPPMESCRATIERQVGQLTHLVDDLLDVSRITQGKIELRRKVLDLREVVAPATEISRPLIDARGHQIQFRLGQEPIWVEGDPARLAQVVSNLLNNAAKYTPDQGRIEVSLERTADAAVLRVTDTGIGLRREDLQRVFEPFVQCDHSLDRAQGGLGIGLSLVRRIVDLHSGQVSADSEGPGQGSTFSLRLPLRKQDSEPMPQPHVSESPTKLRDASSVRVLVVDDNVDAADSLTEFLSLTGHLTEMAHDGQTALERVETFRPDVLLLDLGLPRMNGYDVAREVRRRHGAQMMIVALSGYGRDEDRQQTHDVGFNHHFVKPVDPQALLALLASAQDFTLSA
jgi:CheY-like chemotaxis protein/two-component sensor histidine kinase